MLCFTGDTQTVVNETTLFKRIYLCLNKVIRHVFGFEIEFFENKEIGKIIVLFPASLTKILGYNIGRSGIYFILFFNFILLMLDTLSFMTCHCSFRLNIFAWVFFLLKTIQSPFEVSKFGINRTSPSLQP